MGHPPDGGVDAPVDAALDLLPDWSAPDLGSSEPSPHGPELCDNHLDDDGNGLVDEGCFCLPDTQEPCYPGPMRLAGVGSCAMGVQRCVGTGEFGGWGKCEGAKTPSGEMCDGMDNDCNGRVDDGCECTPGEKRACYAGPAGTASVGTCREGTSTCLTGTGGIGSFWGPCDGDVRPDREVCDGMDNDCNGTVDDGCECRPGESRRCYGGAAGTEGNGPCAAGTQSCLTKPNGSEWGPCEGQTLPKPELCDKVDNDCDGTVDDGCACTPGAMEACYDGPAGTRSVAPCADGVRTCLSGPGGVGSDWGPCTGTRLPGAELCNDVDDDCDGTIDDGCLCRRGDTRACYDGPPSTAGVGLCRSGSQACIVEAGVARFGPCTGQILPEAGGETCNGLDDDCDGRVDGIARTCGSNVGDCRPGTETCTAGAWGACTGAVGPTPEDCNGGDEDCDGMVDEGCACFNGATRSCGPPEAGTGRCKAGTQQCVLGKWAGCDGAIGPVSETCNLVDDDCDGTIDNGCICLLGETRACYDGPAGTAGVAACRAGTQTCVAQAGVATWGPCAGEVLPAMEICNSRDDDCNGMTDDGLSTPEQVIVPRGQNREADLLFMIDNSRSMQASQTSLVANFPILMNTLRQFPGGLPNLHIAVVNSDLGAGPETSIGNCRPGGDGGVFRAPATGCQGPTGTFIVESDNEATKNYPGTIDDAFRCIANVGIDGCGLEHQIASAARALGWGGTIPTANQGFLRPDAFLAIAFITDEDDCSAPPDTQLFSSTVGGLADPWGPLGSFRCNEFGHICGTSPPPRIGTAPVTLTNCRPADAGPLYPIGPFVDFFRSLKADPNMLFVSAITGPVGPYTINYNQTVSSGTELWPVMAHSCTRASTGSYADPALRMADFVSRFGVNNGSISSICDDSYTPALSQLGVAIGRAFSSHCLDNAVPDADPARDGIQAACQVVLRAPGSTERTLPACDTATPQGGPQPCWYLTSDATCSSTVRFALNRTGATAAGETISIRCPTCR